MKAPAFQFYPKDWDSDANVIPMSYEEEGVYFALCRRYWIDGALPADLDRLRRLLKGRPSLAKMQKWWEVIGPCFTVSGDFLTHKRLDGEREKQVAFREAKARAGAIGGRSRPNNAAIRRDRVAKAREVATHTKEEWEQMVAFFGGVCVRCGEVPGYLVRDHIVPIYQGGHDGISNIQPLCNRCNGQKGPEDIDHRTKWGKQLPSEWLKDKSTNEAVLDSVQANGSSSSSVFGLQSSPAGEEPPARSIPARGYQGGAGSGSNPRDHLKHGWCGERLCVHEVLHREFLRRWPEGQQDEAKAWLKAFYRDTHDALPDGPFSDDAFEFWRGTFKAAFPKAAPAAPARATLGGSAAAVEDSADYHRDRQAALDRQRQAS